MRRALLGHKAHRGHKARLDLRGLRDQQERVETLDRRGTLVHKAPLDRLGPRDQQERVETLDHKGMPVLKVLQDPQVQTGQLGCKEQSARKVRRDLLDRVTPAAPSSTRLEPRSGSQS